MATNSNRWAVVSIVINLFAAVAQILAASAKLPDTIDDFADASR